MSSTSAAPPPRSTPPPARPRRRRGTAALVLAVIAGPTLALVPSATAGAATATTAVRIPVATQGAAPAAGRALPVTTGPLAAARAAADDPARPTTLVVTSDPDVAAVDRETAVAKARSQFEGMAAYWSDISNGDVEFELSGDIVWWPDNGKCRSSSAQRDRVSAGARQVSGFTAGPQKHLIVNVGNCTNFGGWGGGSSLTSGGSFYVEDPKWNGVWTHEIGHTLGFGHANLLACSDGSIDAPVEAEPGADADCRVIDYGDQLDTMGTSFERIYKGFSAPNAVTSGFYDPDEYVTASGPAYDETVTIDSRDTEDAPIAVEVRDPRSDRVYYVELVTGSEYDAGVIFNSDSPSVYDGVSYRASYGVRVLRRTGSRTLLIPSTPNAAGERPTVWAPGQTFTAASEGASVEVVSRTASSATLRVRTFGQPVPTTTADTASTPVGESVEIDALANDAPAPGSSLDATSVVFPDDGQPAGSEVSTDARRLSVPGEGVYTADPATGAVVFAPAQGFTGAATPVTYRVTDANGETATSTVAVTVVQAPPTAVDDAFATSYETPVEADVLTNDDPPTDGEIDATSVVFTDADQPTGATVGDQGRSLEVPDEGEYAVDRTTGVVTFTPELGFDGAATPVTYQVSSVDGGPDTATLSVTVGLDALAPTAADDIVSTPYETEVEIDVAGNDTAAEGRTLDASSVRFPEGDEPDGPTLTVDGEGTYAVDADGLVTFTPADGFTGEATPVVYDVADTEGTRAPARIRVTVGDAPVPPAAEDDTTETAFRTAVTVDVLANDGDGAGLDRTSVVFPDGSRELVVDGEGTYVADVETGKVTFTPEELFVGDAKPVTYRVSGVGAASDLNDTATLEVSVTDPEAPTAVDDTAVTVEGRVVDIHALDNDTSPADLRPSSLVFADQGQPTGAVVSANGRSMVVPGEGQYNVGPSDEDGNVDFRPESGFVGTTSPVTYRVADRLERTASATITVEVEAAPAESTTSVSLARASGPFGTGTTATVRVASDELASGRVTVRVAGRTLSGVLSEGVSVLRLPARLPVGKYTVRASYDGSEAVGPSSATTRLQVNRARPVVRGSLPRATVAAGARAPFVIRLRAPSFAKVVVQSGQRVLLTRWLPANSQKRVLLPRLKPGTYGDLRARVVRNDRLTGAVSPDVRLRVRR